MEVIDLTEEEEELAVSFLERARYNEHKQGVDLEVLKWLDQVWKYWIRTFDKVPKADRQVVDVEQWKAVFSAFSPASHEYLTAKNPTVCEVNRYAGVVFAFVCCEFGERSAFYDASWWCRILHAGDPKIFMQDLNDYCIFYFRYSLLKLHNMKRMHL